MNVKRILLVGLVVIVLAMALPVVALADEGKGELPNLLEVISPSLQMLLEALVAALVPFLAYHAKRLVDEVVKRGRQALTEDQYLMAQVVVTHLVHAAEQIYGQGEGEAKKDYVIQHAQEVLASYGWRLNPVHLESLIESLVHSELKAPEQVAKLSL